MRFLITGHTGFKGAWLSLLLLERGHEVSGLSNESYANTLYSRTNLGNFLIDDIRCDIRDLPKITKHFEEVNPDVVIHLAAQALVRESYKDPITTFETNVLGTLNVLRATQMIGDLKAQLIITTDKVYKNRGLNLGYIESDELGGRDPYSASKAMADIATQSWISSFKNPPTAIARAGNVIGGGDVCMDRLIPDLIQSYSSGLTPKLRAPDSIRPWQHVLDCLNGYLALVEKVMDGSADGAWNFGPIENQSRTVANVADLLGATWGVKNTWEHDVEKHPHEEDVLLLNSEKARSKLGWSDKLNFEESVYWTTRWYKNVHSGNDPLDETLKNIREFEAR